MRIVSLAPAATEIVFALGLGDELMGRSAADDQPPEAVDVPAVTRGGRIEFEAFARARPDMVITQGPSGPGAVGIADVHAAARALGIEPTIVTLDPSSLEGILNGISTVGAFAEAEDEAVGLIEILRQRLAAVEDRVLERRLAGIAPRRVVVLEWLEPPCSSGHWVPEMVRRAGGWDLLGEEGQPSVEVGWERVREVDPDQILLAPRGMDAIGARREWAQATMPVWFGSLRAVQRGDLYALDGGGLLSRPGPRVIDGIAMLAEVFDPDGLRGLAPSGSWMALGQPAGRRSGSR